MAVEVVEIDVLLQVGQRARPAVEPHVLLPDETR